MEWKPIKSAPRDGTRILAFQNWEDKHQPSWVDPDKHVVIVWWYCDAWRDVEAHKAGDNDILGRRAGPVTHWMPLPGAPK